MSAQQKIRLVSSQSDEFRAESAAIQEARGRVEAENAAVLAVHVRARAEAQARAIAEGKLRQENELLAFIEARSRTDLQLVNDVEKRLVLERDLIAASHEKLELEAQLTKEVQSNLRAAQRAKIELESRLVEETRALEEHEKTAILEREAAILAQEAARQEALVAKAIREKINADKEALSLLNGKLIAETARAEGAQRILQQREESIALLKQAELDESVILLLESKARQVAQGKIEAVRELMLVAQQRVDVEMLAARGIEIQLKAEEDAVAAANCHAAMADLAKQAAETRAAQEKQYAQLAEQSFKADQLATQEFDHKLELINERINMAEQHAQLMMAECLTEEKKLALESAVVVAEQERVAIEKVALEALNKRLALQQELAQAAQLRLQTENNAIAEISLRMETELKAIEADNARITLEVGAREIMEAQLRVTAEAVTAAKRKEEVEVSALRMAKLRAESEAQAAQAESDVLKAHTQANQLARQRIDMANKLQQIIDERARDEQHCWQGAKECMTLEDQIAFLANQRKTTERIVLS